MVLDALHHETDAFERDYLRFVDELRRATCLQQHPFQLSEVSRREGLVATQPLQRQV